MSRVRVHNFSVSLDGFGTGEGRAWMPRSGSLDGDALYDAVNWWDQP